MTIELDHLDKLAASVFDGYIVRKDLVRKYSRQYPVPTYVVEFLLGRYCASVDEKELPKLKGLVLSPGMPVEAFVETGERTAMSYFAKPLTDAFHRSFREE